ncbi:LysR substrate-binding domain-containing protein [Curvibacter sp. RS43]|uniref:LysR family transcriptional regulator n=1 Tax=Curvibacter microcysteis TaxID=3026419 RepID=UPI002360AA86|nr:LysR family transcriptional regulator [Curvibacter sp. RS43]MDD0811306.1 LysR substrate-binding domain-containing protein [Curvibacter sp. RS43]
MKLENLDELRVALACAETGSLTASAARLHTSPAAASAALKKLEARLGARLFERSTRSMRITAEGELFTAYARRALDLLDEGQAQLREGDAQLMGTVRLAAPSDLTRRVLLDWLDDFLAAHPGVELQLAVSDSLSDVVRDQVDLALRYGELDDSRLVARRLLTTRRVLCAAPSYLARHGTPQHPSELSQHECLSFVVRGRRLLQWPFTRSDGRESLSVRVHGRRSADDAEIAHRWALAGHGLVCKSEVDLHADLASGALVRVLPDWQGLTMPLYAVLPSNRFVPARVRALIEALAQRCQQSGMGLDGSGPAPASLPSTP